MFAMLPLAAFQTCSIEPPSCDECNILLNTFDDIKNYISIACQKQYLTPYLVSAAYIVQRQQGSSSLIPADDVGRLLIGRAGDAAPLGRVAAQDPAAILVGAPLPSPPSATGSDDLHNGP